MTLGSHNLITVAQQELRVEAPVIKTGPLSLTLVQFEFL